MFQSLSFCQNPLWVNAPFSIINTTLSILPINPDPNQNSPESPYDYYDGNKAEFSSNGIADINGNVKFFIVDGLIYNREGRFLCYAWGNYAKNPFAYPPLNYNADGFTYTVNGNGGGEILIIPHPTNCEQFLIIGSVESYSGQKVSEPYYAFFDYTQEKIIRGGPWYSTYDIDNSSNVVDELFNNQTLLPNGDSQFAGDAYGESTKGVGAVSFACTKPQADGSRFIFGCFGKRIIALKFNSDGSLFYWKRFLIPYSNFYSSGSDSYYRSELEVHQDPNNQNITLAFSKRCYISSNYASVVQILDYSPDFMFPLTAGEFAFFVNDVNNNISAVKGLEFTKSGKYLYITTNSNNSVPSEVYYVDRTNPTPQLVNLGLSLSHPLEFSFIERSSDNKLMFSTPNGLYSLSNPDSPDPNNFSNVPVVSFSQSPIFCTPEVTNQTIYNRAFQLPDQLDQENYLGIFTQTTECCINNIGYTRVNYTATQNATWQPGSSSNPFNSVSGIIKIKNELRIPANVTITIKNMRFEFAPGARVVIDHGSNGTQGGKLILDKTTFTAETTCTKDFWLGVEVWGNQQNSQGTINNSTQGRIVLQNSALIEHASIGILTSKRLATFTFDDSRTGGIVQVVNSTLKDNQRGIWFRKYQGINNANNLSFVSSSKLIWTNDFIANNVVQVHVTMDMVSGIYIKGSELINSINVGNQSLQGRGILSRQSKFSVLSACTGQVPINGQCQNSIPTKFIDLDYGVHASSSDNVSTYVVDKSIFSNCRYGIYSLGVNAERITNNNFEVREHALAQSAGAAIYNSTGYTIQENKFYEKDNPLVANGDGKSYGLVINNSGVLHNEVYLNEFYNLMVGGQSEKRNGEDINNSNNTLTKGL